MGVTLLSGGDCTTEESVHGKLCIIYSGPSVEESKENILLAVREPRKFCLSERLGPIPCAKFSVDLVVGNEAMRTRTDLHRGKWRVVWMSARPHAPPSLGSVVSAHRQLAV